MEYVDILPQNLRAALEQFAREAEKIVGSFAAPLEEKEPPDIIYHYTDDAGLKGILETGQLWLTDIFSLNDPSELKHGFSHAIKILSDKTSNGSNNSKVFAKNFETFISKGGIHESAHYFSCSFSSDGDDLGQWRAYADNGCGYALGFDAQALENGFGWEAGVRLPNNTSFPITYHDDTLIDLHRQIIDSMIALIALPDGSGIDKAVFLEYMQELSICLTVYTLHAAVFFKHEAYKHENEYRFLQIHRGDLPPPDAKIRLRPHTLVKYREFDWRSVAPHALKKIVIGPAADLEKSPRFVNDCLRLFHSGIVKLEYSAIPYRAS